MKVELDKLFDVQQTHHGPEIKDESRFKVGRDIKAGVIFQPEEGGRGRDIPALVIFGSLALVVLMVFGVALLMASDVIPVSQVLPANDAAREQPTADPIDGSQLLGASGGGQKTMSETNNTGTDQQPPTATLTPTPTGECVELKQSLNLWSGPGIAPFYEDIGTLPRGAVVHVIEQRWVSSEGEPQLWFQIAPINAYYEQFENGVWLWAQDNTRPTGCPLSTG